MYDIENSGIHTEQGSGKTGVSKMQLGCFDKPAQSVTVPWRQMFQEKYFFQQHHIVTNRRATQLKRRCHLGHIDQACSLTGGKLEKLGYQVQSADTSQIPHIPLHECFDIVTIPKSTSFDLGAQERRRIATCGDPFGQRRAETLDAAVLKPGGKQDIKEAGCLSGDFILRKRLRTNLGYWAESAIASIRKSDLRSNESFYSGQLKEFIPAKS